MRGWGGGAEAVQRRLQALIARERLDDLMTVHPLPDEVEVRSWT